MNVAAASGLGTEMVSGNLCGADNVNGAQCCALPHPLRNVVLDKYLTGRHSTAGSLGRLAVHD